MKKLLILLSLFLIINTTYALNEEYIRVGIYDEKNYIFKVVDLDPYFQSIETKDGLGKELSWDLSLLDENEEYKNLDKNSLKVFINYGNWKFLPVEKEKQGKYIKDKNIYQFFAKETGMYVIMPVIPNPDQKIEFVGGKEDYLGDNKSVYNLETKEIFYNDNTLVKDGYKFIILPQKGSSIILESDTVKKKISQDTGVEYWEIEIKNGKLSFDFKVLSNNLEEIIYVYNDEIKKVEGIFKFDINPIKIKLETPKNILINGNKISWNKVDMKEREIKGYKVYVKKEGNDHFNDFYCNNGVCQKGEIISQIIYLNDSTETTIDFSSGDKYYIQISAYDVFGNESEKSDPILFDWSVNCVDETLCRPTNYNPVEVDSTNSSPIKENITQDSDIITPYFSNYKNINSIKESQVYKNIYLNNGTLLKQEIDLKEGIPFKRYYNSRPALINSKIGLGWNHNYDAYFDYNDNGNISVILPDGTFARFTLDKDFNYISSDNTGLKVKDELNNIIITNIVGDIYTFSKNKQRLEKVQYKNFPEFIINYDSEGKIISVKSTGNCKSELIFNYDHNNLLSSIRDMNGKEIKFNYDLKTLGNETYLFLDEIKYDENNSISYNYNNAGLLTGDNDFRYRFDNNKVTDFQDLENNKYFQVVYSGSIVNIFEKDEMYKKILSEQKIELNNSGSILNISIQAGIIEYNYTSSGILESIKDEKGNIKKIENTFGEFKCSGNITSTSVGNKNTDKIQKVIDKVDNYINKKTKGNPNDEIKTIRKSLIDKISLLKTPEKIIDKGIYKKELKKLVKDLQSAIKRDVKNIN